MSAYTSPEGNKRTVEGVVLAVVLLVVVTGQVGVTF